MLRKSAACVLFLVLASTLIGVGKVRAQDPTPPPEIDLSASRHDFGMVKVGYAEDWVLRIANRGLGQLDVYDITIDHPAFQITEPDTFPQSVKYSGGPHPDTLYVTVAFRPPASGYAAGRLTVSSNDADEETLYVAVEGTGVAPEINLFETTHDYNGVVVGSASDWSLAINNTGPADLVIHEVVSTDPSFIVTAPPFFPQSVPAGGRLNLVTTFRPTSGGVKTGNLIIRSDDPDEGTLYVSLLGSGLAADISLSALSHDFGEQMVSSPVSWTLMVSNSGTLDLIISQALISSPAFTVVSPPFPQTIHPAGNLTVEVQFQPTVVGPVEGTLTLRSNDPDESSVVVTLLGAGIPRSPDIAVSAVSHDFGDVRVGTSSTWVLTIENTGLDYLNISSAITNQAEFSVITPTFPQQVFVGRTLDVTIAYTPTSAGERSSVLTIRSNDPDEAEVTVSLFGQGVSPDVSLSATAHNYGHVILGTSAVWQITVFNEGTADLVVESMVPSHPNFSVVNQTFPVTIPAGGSVTYAIVFSPSSLGLIAGNVTINTNDPKNPVLLVSVSGMGVKPDIYLSDDSHEFGSVFAGGSASWPLVIRNLGTASLTVSAVFSNNPAFTIPEPTFPLTIDPGHEQQVTVVFRPTAVQEVTGNLSIISNDPETGTLIVHLHGRGSPPPAPRLLLAENTHNYDMVDVGESSEWRVYVYNRGDLDLVVTRATSDNPDFQIIYPPVFPQTVAPLSNMHLTVDFVPSRAGTRTGHISIYSNDPDLAIATVTVTGYGSAPDIEIASLSHDYGKVLLLNPKEWAMQVINQGSKPLIVDEVSSNRAEFVVTSPTFPQTIAPGTEITVIVTFMPVSKGLKTGTISISSNDPFESDLTVEVMGLGVATAIHVSDPGYHYAPTAVGDTAAWTFIITNVGEEDLVVDHITSSHPDFVILSPVFPQQLRSYCGIEVTVGFKPSSSGTKTGSLTIFNNDSFQPCAPLQLEGTGIAPDIAVSANSHGYGDVLLGQSRSWTLALSNLGTDYLVIDSLVTGTDAFSVVSPLFPQVLAPGAGIDVAVAFHPTALGQHSGLLSIFSDDYDEGLVAVSLSGRGVSPEIELSAMSHDFGQLWPGDCVSWTLTITNGGDYDLMISGIEGDCPEFAVLQPVDFPQKIHPRCDLDVTVSFCPAAVGLKSCPLVITTNHPDMEQITISLEGEGVLPEIAASELAHNFGGLALGESAAWSVTISNRGTAPLTVQDMDLTNTVDFSIPAYSFPVIIEPKAGLDIPVVFEPQSSTHKESDLIITSNDPSNPVLTIHLKGKGLVRDILLSETSHTFGSVVVGQQMAWTFTISNLGQLPLEISEVVSSHADFTVVSPVFPCTLSNGVSVEVTVAFLPSSIGARSSALEVHSNDPDESILTLQVSGVGVAPEVTLSSYSHDFGSILVGLCAAWSVAVYNTGTSDLVLLSVTTDNPDYAVAVPALPLVIAPQDSQMIGITYCPSAPGDGGGNLSVCVDGTIDACIVIPLAGRGVIQDIALSSTQHNYGSVYVGGTSNWVLMLMNVGTANLLVEEVLSDQEAFEVVSPAFPRVIPPEGSVGVVVAFTPPAVGSHSAHLTITSDDPDEASLAVPLTGQGVLPGFHVSATAHDFGTIIAGDSARWTFTISNTGGARLTVAGVVSDQAEFIITHPLFPQTLGPGEGLAVGVLFAPSTSGDKSGILTIETDDPGAPQATVEVTGRAVVTDIRLSENQHDFGPVLVGSTSSWSLTLANGGRAEMTILAIDSGEPAFVVVSDELPLILAPGESLGVGVDFTPPAFGPYEGTLTIDIADFSASPPTVALTGSGVQQDIEVAAQTHSFGNVVMGESLAWILDLTNAGTADLTVNSIATDHPDFTIGEVALPLVLAPGISESIEVSFKPSAAQPVQGHLTILSDDPDEGEITITLSGRGVDANVYTSDSFHDFGDVVLGGHEEWIFRLYNLGKVDLHVQEVAADCQAFSILSPAFPQTIGRGAHVDITVGFSPATAEAETCTLAVITDDPDEGTLSVVVTGRGIGRQIDVEVRGISFGQVRVGSAVDRTLTVYNRGLLALTIDEMISSHGDYTVVEPLFPQDIGPQDSLLVTIAFAPSKPGPAEGMLHIGSNDPLQPLLTVSLDGAGIAPEVQLSAVSHDYGKVYVGGMSNWVLRVHNVGTDDLVVSGASSDHPDFTILSPVFPQTLPPDTSLGVVVQYHPQAIGAAHGALTVTSDDADEGSLTVALSGEGALPDIEVSATSHDFGEVVANDTSQWTFTISNLGSANLMVENISSDRSDFHLISPSFFPQTMPPASHMDVTVAFVPRSGQEISGHLTIESSDPAEPVVTIGLMGIGIAADLYIAADGHDFGDVVVGDTALWVLPLHNIGRAPLIVHASAIQNSDFQLLSPTFPKTIQPGQHVNATFAFIPSILGESEGVVTFSSNDVAQPSVDVTLSGSGVGAPLLMVTDGSGDPGSAGNAVYIDLHTPVPIAGVAFGLTYDSELLTITDVQLTDYSDHMGVFNIAFPHEDQVVILVQDLGGGTLPPRSGSVVELTMRVAAQAPLGKLPLHLIGVILYGAGGSALPSMTQDGLFTVTVPDIAVPVQDHDYGDVPVFHPVDWPCLVSNAGTKDLIIQSVTTDHVDFYATEPAFPCTVAAAESIEVNFRLAASTVGELSAVATLSCNDPDEGTVVISLAGTGIKPDICMGEVIHDFGRVVVGASSTWQAPITNLGRGDLILTDLFTVGSDFAVDSLLPLHYFIPQRETILVDVTFTPSFVGAIRGSLVVISNDPFEGRFVLPLWGTGVAPDIELSASSHDYGQVDIGAQGIWDLVVYNTGQADLTVDSVAAGPGQFTVLSVPGPYTVAPGDSLVLSTAFTPTAIDGVAGNLTIYSNDSDESILSVTLTGQGAGPDIDLTSSSFIFGRVKLGDSEEWAFSISNEGTRDLTVESVMPDVPDFLILSPEFPQLLGPHDDILVQVSFKPLSVGMIHGKLTIVSDDPDEDTLFVTMMGHGVEPEIELSTGRIDFGDVALGSSARETFAIRNLGEASLLVSDITIDQADFAIADFTFPLVVAKRGSLEVEVTFTPSAMGAVQGTLIVASDDADEPVLPIELSAEGIPPATLRIGSGHGTPGSENNAVFVYLNNTVGVATARFLINYDPDVLTVADVQATSRIDNMGSFEWDIPKDGEILVVISDFGNEVIEPGEGAIVRVGFDVDAGAESGTAPLTLTGVALYDLDENDILTGIDDGYFTIGTSYVYNFGDVVLGQTSSITLDYVLPGHYDGDLVIAGISCDHPDFTISAPVHCPLVVGSVSSSAELSLTIVFTPSQPGEEWALIEVCLAEPEEETLLLPIVGKGVSATQGSWNVALTCRSSDVSLPDSIGTKELVFGVDSSGSEDYDPELDMALPPLPPVVVFEAYFPEEILVGRLSKDIRSSFSKNIEWMVETMGTPGTMFWNPADLPEGDFKLNGTINMRSTGQVTFAKNEILTITYTSTQSAVQLSYLSVQFGQGWATVHWETAVEENLAGFNVYRVARTGVEPRPDQRLNTALITGSHSYSYTDKTAEPGEVYYYWIEAVGHDGLARFVGSVSGQAMVPQHFVLGQNYPNPFNPETHISYTLDDRDAVSLIIYNCIGQKVRLLVNGPQAPGTYTVTWDGCDDQGRLVPTGTYFYRITVGDVSETKKMVMLK